MGLESIQTSFKPYNQEKKKKKKYHHKEGSRMKPGYPFKTKQGKQYISRFGGGYPGKCPLLRPTVNAREDWGGGGGRGTQPSKLGF